MSKIKKTLKEVFEFFPNAKWITQDGRESDDRTVNIYFGRNKPFQDFNSNDWWQVCDKNGDSRDIVNLLPNDLQLDWQGRRTWKDRCVSREEIIGGVGEK